MQQVPLASSSIALVKLLIFLYSRQKRKSSLICNRSPCFGWLLDNYSWINFFFRKRNFQSSTYSHAHLVDFTLILPRKIVNFIAITISYLEILEKSKSAFDFLDIAFKYSGTLFFWWQLWQSFCQTCYIAVLMAKFLHNSHWLIYLEPPFSCS